MIETFDAGFGRRLRMERERRRITLASIAENTKIGLSLLKGLERDDLSRWPSGIFRRSFVHARRRLTRRRRDRAGVLRALSRA
jgi:hypothetical protein